MDNTNDIAPVWTTHSTKCGTPMYDECTIGPAKVIVWTGSPAVDLDNSDEVCEAFIPLRSKGHPDGLMIVGRRRLGRISREDARSEAVQLTMAELNSRGLAVAA